MIHLRRPKDSWIRHPEDVATLRRALNAAGYDATDVDIQWAHGMYSKDEFAAGWMSLDYVNIDWAVRHILIVLERCDAQPEATP